MLARAALALSVLLLAFVLGLANAPSSTPAALPAHPLRIAQVRLDAPGDTAADAAAALVASHPPPPSPVSAVQVARVVAPPPLLPPPPPRPEAVLRASLAAVSDDHGALGLVLRGGDGRALKAGDRFMGWTLASVTRSGAVLRKGAESRPVSFFGPPPSSAPLAGAPRADFLPAPVAPAGRPPTAAEYFAGFKG